METLPVLATKVARGHRGMVLLVDDEPLLLECASELLEKIGFSVIQAKDGQEAVEAFQIHHAELTLVVMDIAMPRLNGIGATQRLREIDPRPKIILSSGYSVESPWGAGADAFLPKPYRGADLWSVIQRVLSIDK